MQLDLCSSTSFVVATCAVEPLVVLVEVDHAVPVAVRDLEHNVGESGNFMGSDFAVVGPQLVFRDLNGYSVIFQFLEPPQLFSSAELSAAKVMLSMKSNS